jgi:hypothetical protein
MISDRLYSFYHILFALHISSFQLPITFIYTYIKQPIPDTLGENKLLDFITIARAERRLKSCHLSLLGYEQICDNRDDSGVGKPVEVKV